MSIFNCKIKRAILTSLILNMICGYGYTKTVGRNKRIRSLKFIVTYYEVSYLSLDKLIYNRIRDT